MYQHHKDSIQNLINYFSDRDEIIALVLDGSVAKGTCRPDSDIDGIVIVTEAYYQERKEANILSEVVQGHCTYEGGYFDLKYFTKEIITIAAEKAGEPIRSAFIGSRVLFTRDPEIPDIIAKIPVFQDNEAHEKMMVFCANLALNSGYYWGLREESKYLKYHIAAQIVYCCYRIILQENRILFPCNRSLEKAVLDAPNHPGNIVELANIFLDRMDDESLNTLLHTTKSWMKFKEPEQFNVLLTKFTEYYEQWWLNPKPMVSEW